VERTQIQDAANDIIKKNIEIKEYTMERKTAEEKYSKYPVNHTYIYDKFPVKAEITTLSLIEIPDWNINCCQGPHVKTTGELEALCILKIKKKGNKGEIEVIFDIGQPAVEGLKAQLQPQPSSGRVKVDKRPKPKNASTTTQQSTKPSDASKETKYGTKQSETSNANNQSYTSSVPILPVSSLLTNPTSDSAPVPSKTEVKQESQGATRALVLETTNQLLDDFLSILRPNPSLLKDEESLKNALLPQIQFTLSSFQNLAYAEGYSSRLRNVNYNI